MTRAEWRKLLRAVQGAESVHTLIGGSLSTEEKALLDQHRRCESPTLRALFLALRDRWPDWNPVAGIDLIGEGLLPEHPEYDELIRLSQMTH